MNKFRASGSIATLGSGNYVQIVVTKRHEMPGENVFIVE